MARRFRGERAPLRMFGGGAASMVLQVVYRLLNPAVVSSLIRILPISLPI